MTMRRTVGKGQCTMCSVVDEDRMVWSDLALKFNKILMYCELAELISLDGVYLKFEEKIRIDIDEAFRKDRAISGEHDRSIF